MFFFFFKQKTAYEMRISDWSSDVCSSDLVIAFVIAAGMNVFAYWNSDKVVLRMYGAREVDARTAPELYGMVKQLALSGELPMPRVYIIETEKPHAFATGRNPPNSGAAAHTHALRTPAREGSTAREACAAHEKAAC